MTRSQLDPAQPSKTQAGLDNELGSWSCNDQVRLYQGYYFGQQFKGVILLFMITAIQKHEPMC